MPRVRTEPGRSARRTGCCRSTSTRPTTSGACVTDGRTLRLLRDNASLSRAAYVEADLEAMFREGVYSDFVLLYLLLHRSRLPRQGQPPEEAWLEIWRREGEASGARALDDLRGGVEKAIRALGQGFIEHPDNDTLRQRLRSGELGVQDYYRQLLRLVYRLLFLLAAEERDLLFAADAAPRQKEVYRDYYGVNRLRDLARRRSTDPHDDLWQGMQVLFRALREEEPASCWGSPARRFSTAARCATSTGGRTWPRAVAERPPPGGVARARLAGDRRHAAPYQLPRHGRRGAGQRLRGTARAAASPARRRGAHEFDLGTLRRAEDDRLLLHQPRSGARADPLRAGAGDRGSAGQAARTRRSGALPRPEGLRPGLRQRPLPAGRGAADRTGARRGRRRRRRAVTRCRRAASATRSAIASTASI